MKIKDRRLTRNAAQCVKCNEVIESTFRHDWVQCKCGAIFVDGGLDYARSGGEIYDYIDLCEYEEYEREEYGWETDKREAQQGIKK